MRSSKRDDADGLADKRRRQIVAELEALTKTRYSPANLTTIGGALIWEAYTLGAFERSDPAT
jgi:hypothetical protein